MTFEIRSEARTQSAYDDPPVEGEEAALGAFLLLIRKEQRLPKAATLYFGPVVDDTRQSEGESIMWGDTEANRAFTKLTHEAIMEAAKVNGE